MADIASNGVGRGVGTSVSAGIMGHSLGSMIQRGVASGVGYAAGAITTRTINKSLSNSKPAAGNGNGQISANHNSSSEHQCAYNNYSVPAQHQPAYTYQCPVEAQPRRNAPSQSYQSACNYSSPSEQTFQAAPSWQCAQASQSWQDPQASQTYRQAPQASQWSSYQSYQASQPSRTSQWSQFQNGNSDSPSGSSAFAQKSKGMWGSFCKTTSNCATKTARVAARAGKNVAQGMGSLSDKMTAKRASSTARPCSTPAPLYGGPVNFQTNTMYYHSQNAYKARKRPWYQVFACGAQRD